MALKKEVPEFDVDDAVLLMEPSLNVDPDAEISRVGSGGTKSKTATVKQHKFIDYTRALDATQLYLNEIGFSP
ncbi:MAG TPA: RNA polymerase sigma factor RpoS, partial [Pseudomonas sp.]|nr:RNA polymerase sigma factor RpoS [Pseudomonas sp.]